MVHSDNIQIKKIINSISLKAVEQQELNHQTEQCLPGGYETLSDRQPLSPPVTDNFCTIHSTQLYSLDLTDLQFLNLVIYLLYLILYILIIPHLIWLLYTSTKALHSIFAIPSTALFWTEMSDVIPGICRRHLLSLGVTAPSAPISMVMMVPIFAPLLSRVFFFRLWPSSWCAHVCLWFHLGSWFWHKLVPVQPSFHLVCSLTVLDLGWNHPCMVSSILVLMSVASISSFGQLICHHIFHLSSGLALSSADIWWLRLS